jgi:hypothetical protein
MNDTNIWAKEPPMYTDKDYIVPHNERAELLNGRLAMLGFMAAMCRLRCDWSNHSWSILMPKVGKKFPILQLVKQLQRKKQQRLVKR